MYILRRLLIRLVPNGEDLLRQNGIEETFKEATGVLNARDRRGESNSVARVVSVCCTEAYEDCICESPSFEVSAYREGLRDGAQKHNAVSKP